MEDRSKLRRQLVVNSAIDEEDPSRGNRLDILRSKIATTQNSFIYTSDEWNSIYKLMTILANADDLNDMEHDNILQNVCSILGMPNIKFSNRPMEPVDIREYSDIPGCSGALEPIVDVLLDEALTADVLVLSDMYDRELSQSVHRQAPDLFSKYNSVVFNPLRNTSDINNYISYFAKILLLDIPILAETRDEILNVTRELNKIVDSVTKKNNEKYQMNEEERGEVEMAVVEKKKSRRGLKASSLDSIISKKREMDKNGGELPREVREEKAKALRDKYLSKAKNTKTDDDDPFKRPKKKGSPEKERSRKSRDDEDDRSSRRRSKRDRDDEDDDRKSSKRRSIRSRDEDDERSSKRDRDRDDKKSRKYRDRDERSERRGRDKKKSKLNTLDDIDTVKLEKIFKKIVKLDTEHDIIDDIEDIVDNIESNEVEAIALAMLALSELDMPKTLSEDLRKILKLKPDRRKKSRRDDDEDDEDDRSSRRKKSRREEEDDEDEDSSRRSKRRQNKNRDDEGENDMKPVKVVKRLRSLREDLEDIGMWSDAKSIISKLESGRIKIETIEDFLDEVKYEDSSIYKDLRGIEKVKINGGKSSNKIKKIVSRIADEFDSDLSNREMDMVEEYLDGDTKIEKLVKVLKKSDAYDDRSFEKLINKLEDLLDEENDDEDEDDDRRSRRRSKRDRDDRSSRRRKKSRRDDDDEDDDDDDRRSRRRRSKRDEDDDRRSSKRRRSRRDRDDEDEDDDDRSSRRKKSRRDRDDDDDRRSSKRRRSKRDRDDEDDDRRSRRRSKRDRDEDDDDRRSSKRRKKSRRDRSDEYELSSRDIKKLTRIIEKSDLKNREIDQLINLLEDEEIEELLEEARDLDRDIHQDIKKFLRGLARIDSAYLASDVEVTINDLDDVEPNRAYKEVIIDQEELDHFAPVEDDSTEYDIINFVADKDGSRKNSMLI